MESVASADVLVVEDDPDLSELVSAYLELASLPCRRALDGAAALRAMKERRPALVLLDLMLPDLDGFEVCRRIREDEETRDLPVVILTALDEAGPRQKARALGVNDYLTKPFDPDVLIDTIRRNMSGGAGRTSS